MSLSKYTYKVLLKNLARPLKTAEPELVIETLVFTQHFPRLGERQKSHLKKRTIEICCGPAILLYIFFSMKRATSVWLRLKRFICCRVHSCFGIRMLSTICWSSVQRRSSLKLWMSDWLQAVRVPYVVICRDRKQNLNNCVLLIMVCMCRCKDGLTILVCWACVQDNTCSFLDGIYFIIYHNIDPWWDFLQWQYVVMFVRTYFDGLFKCYMIIVFSRIVLFWT
jgi:hypothetical protein